MNEMRPFQTAVSIRQTIRHHVSHVTSRVTLHGHRCKTINLSLDCRTLKKQTPRFSETSETFTSRRG